jgi:ornithine cyclodeaminase/alanine dehydrogenase-like protein (mu-crystallin family)
VIRASDIVGTLGSLCSSIAVERTGRRTVFKAVGTALEDLAAAILV